MSVTAEDAARAALRERLGAGARYDSPAAPARELLWARRGTAYFARKLNELRDDELDAPSPGTRLDEAAPDRPCRLQCPGPVPARGRGPHRGRDADVRLGRGTRKAEIDLGSTLPPRALRNLFDHAAVHLSVEWRDLPDEGWDAGVRTLDGRIIPARETAWIRSREVWVHAVDLDNGGSFLDFPPDLLEALLAAVLRTWTERSEKVDLLLAPTDRPRPIQVGAGTGPTITGRMADLVRWLTGRGARRLVSSTGALPGIPRWL